ncbi:MULTISPECIES: cation diffusion facilitator family transporter [Campylobacter]|uniref:Cation diffusion facilitator family transporter n=1 Tax=Campylobacter porcelli TaxID=1660073 RepID=A0A1X9SV62_9BACT|nr:MULTISPECIES: cation transporter [unclassified Campylobacter]MCR8679193.1 cation transporter [Campylobacter sp. RM19072]MCR8696699.1 cation transporter [Campylobacter sp. RM19073]MEE3705158.1 cation transporter [Campylobacter sp. CX2-8023-23]MEE3777103.1 cation transporter [Campylobacter sp. CX2-4080-23]ARR00135.1 cation diffusion facilitator family transporter [Campylobacter sp. RM6137]
MIKPPQNKYKKIRNNIEQPLTQSQKEQFTLKISLYCAVVLAIFGISYGIYIGSKAIIFDGLVAFLSIILILLSVITSKFIYKEDDDIFQYGYMRFEPMVNLFKSLILLILCVYAIINGIEGILTGGYEVKFDQAMLYSFLSMILSIGIWLFTSYQAKILQSPLISVDSLEWLIDSVLYMGGFLAFGAVWLFDKESQTIWARYLDPTLLVVLSMILAIMPLKVFIKNLADLAMVAPKDMDDKIDTLLQNISKKYNFSDYDTHVAKSGRFFMIEINILMGESFKIQSIDEMDQIRDEIEQGLNIPSYKIWLSVSFTKNPKWL